MNRGKKLVMNTSASLIKQLVSVVCGFILPRFFLVQYGSNVNGLVSSITQFLSLISIFDAGMGVVIEASLYKPLAEHDEKGISRVMTSGQRFYRRFVMILGIYVLVTAIAYPLMVKSQFDYFYTLTLVLAISISSFGQYALGVTNSVLLSADQRSYINFWGYTITTVINTVLGVVLIEMNCSVQIVKLVSSLVFLARPIFLAVYVKRKYTINWHEKYDVEPINQKWNGFAQHIAALVVNNTATVVLTLFSTLENVSIYSVYFLVVNSIKEIVNAATAGIRALLGDMIAKSERQKLNKTFEGVEWGLHTLITLLFSMTAILIGPFVAIYTSGVNDANYNVPVFAILLSIAYAVFCMRMPYFAVVQAAGHFKQTQASAIIEAVINILVSVLLVKEWGLIGIACGSVAAMLYRLIYLVCYLSKNILERSLMFFTKNFIVDAITFVSVLVSSVIITYNPTDYLQWTLYALYVGIICGIEVIIINFIFYKKQMLVVLSALKKRFR